MKDPFSISPQKRGCIEYRRMNYIIDLYRGRGKTMARVKYNACIVNCNQQSAPAAMAASSSGAAVGWDMERAGWQRARGMATGHRPKHVGWETV